MVVSHPTSGGFAVPHNEEERLRALATLDLGRGNEQIDRICALARDLFKVPIALVSVVGRDEHSYLATCGLNLCDTPRQDSFCSHALLRDDPLVIEDARESTHFRDNVYVRGAPYVRFYAGAPLRLDPGISIGTLCVIDQAPRAFSDEDRAHLSALAELIVSELRGQRADRELCASRKRLAQTAGMAKISGWELHLPSGELVWEDGIYAIYGIPPGTPPAHELIIRRYDPQMRGRSRRRLAALLATGAPYDVELRGTRPNGAVFWVRTMAEAEMADGKVTRVRGAVQDITERKLAEERIHRLAYRDALTGLPNRVSFLDKLERSVERSHRAGGSFALAKFNLDHFHNINDALGHQSADVLLQRLANGLAQKFGNAGTVARIGGDEFAVILRDPAAVAEAPRLVGDFVDQAKHVFRDDKASLPVSISGGLAMFPDHGDDTETIMKNARLALFEAKAKGRGRAVTFEPGMRAAIEETNDLIGRIWTGIAHREFKLYYQPIIGLRDGKVAGLEALMRWDDPARGLLAPAHFMIGFETPDLALALGEQALNRAVAQMRTWLDAGVDFGSVALNLTTAQFRQGNLADLVLERLSRARIPPHRLSLEVTENVYMAWGAETVAETVRKLHAAGVRIALDDFGTGYASLSHLRQFPIDTLKIDKSFVQSSESVAIVDAVINMGVSLGMHVVAEGVEKPEQLALLRLKGCDYVQGYVFAPPLMPERVPAFIAGFSAGNLRPAASG